MRPLRWGKVIERIKAGPKKTLNPTWLTVNAATLRLAPSACGVITGLLTGVGRPVHLMALLLKAGAVSTHCL